MGSTPHGVSAFVAIITFFALFSVSVFPPLPSFDGVWNTAKMPEHHTLLRCEFHKAGKAPVVSLNFASRRKATVTGIWTPPPESRGAYLYRLDSSYSLPARQA